VAHLGKEVFGEKALVQIAAEAYGNSDPAAVMHKEDPYQFSKTEEGYQLNIKMPFIGEKDFSLQKLGDEIVIQLDNRRKNIFLPRFVNFYEMQSYQYEEPWLKISLKP
jgi:arsenite-transporting ATPase